MTMPPRPSESNLLQPAQSGSLCNGGTVPLHASLLAVQLPRSRSVCGVQRRSPDDGSHLVPPSLCSQLNISDQPLFFTGHLIAELFLWFCVRSCHIQRRDLRCDGESCVVSPQRDATRPSESRIQDHRAIVQTRLPRSN